MLGYLFGICFIRFSPYRSPRKGGVNSKSVLKAIYGFSPNKCHVDTRNRSRKNTKHVKRTKEMTQLSAARKYLYTHFLAARWAYPCMRGSFLYVANLRLKLPQSSIKSIQNLIQSIKPPHSLLNYFCRPNPVQQFLIPQPNSFHNNDGIIHYIERDKIGI